MCQVLYFILFFLLYEIRKLENLNVKTGLDFFFF